MDNGMDDEAGGRWHDKRMEERTNWTLDGGAV